MGNALLIISVCYALNSCPNHRDGLPPYAEVSLPTLNAVQPYDFTLHLDVPAIESNFHLGNFMSTLTLSTTSNKTIVTTRRPVSRILCVWREADDRIVHGPSSDVILDTFRLLEEEDRCDRSPVFEVVCHWLQPCHGQG